MSNIRILPELISNKIAAGEVVERPASVVKELVENALDAGSRRILIEVENGGRSLIRVSDDGSGMNHDDALLALERYATSKIFTDQDLFAIATLGFRGEALPSIAAVSKFTLTTREKGSDSGTRIRVEGGKIKNVTEVGAAPGTMISVKQLFYNTPARRKFMKSVTTEMGHIGDVVAGIALGRPKVSFKLQHNSKTVKNWPAGTDRLGRAADVLGRGLQRELYPVEAGGREMSVSGWIASPRVTRKTSRGIFIFVNERCVRDRVIQHAIFDGYRQRLVKGQFPLAVIFLTVPFHQVDVNVHPAKHQVRFADQRRVHDLVKSAVAQTLDREDRPDWSKGSIAPHRISDKDRGTADNRPSAWDVESSRRTAKSEIREHRPLFRTPSVAPEPVFWKPEAETRSGPPSHVTATPNGPAKPAEAPPPGSRETSSEDAPLDPSPQMQERRFADLRFIGQLRNTYVVCESPGGLVLIDQHAAHERVYFEELQRRTADRKKESQKLLVPETVELDYREAGILEKLLEQLEPLGLDIEPFGGNTFVIKAVPSLLAGREAAPLVREIVEAVADSGLEATPEKALDECLKRMACHGAIRARQSLDETQVNALLRQLDACGNPSHCPHGRPTWIHWDVRELEKLFNRVL